MTEANFPLLSLLIITLPVGGALIWLWPNAAHARWIALATAIADLLLSMTVLFQFDADVSGFQLVEQAQWIPSINAQYQVGVDGLSVLFLPLTVILFIGVILSSWRSVTHMQRLYFSLMLLLESATLGIFCALDGILFMLFWEMTLIPIYFLVSFWGVGPNRRFAAVKYLLFMLAGGLPLIFGFVLLAFSHAEMAGSLPGGLTFDYLTWLSTPLPLDIQKQVFLLLLLGFAFKIPVVPLHTWLPLMAMQGPVSVTATIVGLKLGAYGVIRYVVPLAPQAAQEFAWLLATLGAIGIVYGAVAAMAQTNLRRMLAFSSISHVGLVLLGIASFTQQGIQGAIFQLLNFVVVASGLFLITGLLHHRIGSTDIISLGGAARSMPKLATFFLLFGLASMGIPGTSGFPAEFLILYSAITTHTGAGLAALVAVILGAAYFVSIYRKAFFGPVTNAAVAQSVDLQTREFFIIGMFAVLILIAGFYPAGVLDMIDVSTQDWVNHLKP
ncbi:MAG: NADH-quinone oxidoreductase subunit M [Gammaproteobacteria bacterium]|nr:NADH-quinone oxidoreductase subunit M [Gammaproteobacteria bacterium]